MTNKELIDQILNIPAESQNIEFKRVAGSKNNNGRIIESIVAMANTDGGVIILGVDDPEKTKSKGLNRIYGIDENIENFDILGREIQRIIPPLGALWPPDKIVIEEINKTIALLHVPKAIDNFRSINNHVYIRLEKSNKRLTPTEVVKFAYAKGFERADKELVDVDFQLLDNQLFQEWKRQRGFLDESIEICLQKTGLARKKPEDNILYPTRAAVLLFADHPSELMETKAAIRIFQYSGLTEIFDDKPNLIGTPKTIGGPIIQQIQNTHDYVLGLLRSGIKVPSGFVTEYQLPERAIKEAITNAVIHRDYHMKRDIEIKIFENRVAIESPGLFPFNITPANIGKVRSDGWRNDLLVKHLREFPSPPNLDQNEGVKAMRSEMKSRNLYPPIFWTYPMLQDAVRVILLNEKVATEWDKVSSYLEQSKYITNEEARDITGVSQRDRMTQIFRKWVRQGLLIQIIPPTGYVRGTKYRLPTTQDIGNG